MKNEPSSSNKGFNRDKFIAKLQLRKKTQSDDREAQFNSEPKTKGSSEKKEKKELKLEKKKQQQQQQQKERPDKLEMVSEITPLVNVHNGDQQSNNSKEYDTVEKVEELIQMHQLPTETVAIHSPESGTTIF